MPPSRRLQPLPPLIPGSVGPSPENPYTGFILPRQPGESAYEYRYRRTVSIFGQTPYQRRIFLARQRGIGTPAARGHGTRGGVTESQRRNQITLERTGLTTSQLYRGEIRGWLTEFGYTPENTGMTWTQLMRLGPRLRYMYNAVGPGGRVTPQMIREAIELEQTNSLEPGWAFERLWKKYDDMVAYRAFSDKQGGRESWGEYLAVHEFIPDLPAQWWYYR